ncbi:signal transduction histidine kinase [Mycoplana sp. BE70]|uniref:sensor histidine kinase n=1 Tax=Mycoplana sp. BE70 TaxID=2817775 RepID=UPI00285F8D15|nr:ATP-binding protein [Mycoplana sp. BE70]MDR6758050.1 signal transduction histidine kinase [Mycoplana sp. BE70]
MKRKRHSVLVLLAGLATAMFVAALVAAFNYRAGLDDLNSSLSAAGTRLGEKLAQHEAHLTALAAVVRMGEQEQTESVRGLAEAIASFYPRIIEIATIHVEGTSAVMKRYDRPNDPEIREQGSAGLPVMTTPGSTAVRSQTDDVQHYEIYKLVAPGLYLLMKIDAGGLVADGLFPHDYGYQLWLGETRLINRPLRASTLLTATRNLDVNSVSQPLRLEISRGFRATELLPPMIVLPLLSLLAAAFYLLVAYRRAVRAERHQERRAALLEQETKLAHAGRVNALGEMASGIAHELAQPVAALLSQSQAARRAIALERRDILEQALDANVREAKRAGDILGRMRAYIAGGASQLETIPLERALTEAMRLAEPDLARRGIALDTVIVSGERLVRIETIGFQQVIHNILRNAAEALDGKDDLRISIRADGSDKQAVLTITDNGPGIPAAALPHIFEPFFTTKPEGMGLGLPLCARLIEKMDGSMEAVNAGGARFIVRLPLETTR